MSALRDSILALGRELMEIVWFKIIGGLLILLGVISLISPNIAAQLPPIWLFRLLVLLLFLGMFITYHSLRVRLVEERSLRAVVPRALLTTDVKGPWAHVIVEHVFQERSRRASFALSVIRLEGTLQDETSYHMAWRGCDSKSIDIDVGDRAIANAFFVGGVDRSSSRLDLTLYAASDKTVDFQRWIPFGGTVRFGIVLVSDPPLAEPINVILAARIRDDGSIQSFSVEGPFKGRSR